MNGTPCSPLTSRIIEHSCMMRLQLQPTSGHPRWMLDSGALHHYTTDKSNFVTYRKISPQPTETASRTIYGEGIGDMVLELTCGTIRISDLIYVPDMVAHTNLLSVGQLESHGMEFTIKNGTWKIWKDGSLWAVACKENRIYFLQEAKHSPDALISFPALGSSKSSRRTDTQAIEVWHRRLGHINRKYLQLLRNHADGMNFVQDRKYRLDCADWVKSSQRKQISRIPTRQAQAILEIVHADICGPMQECDFWGHRYFTLFVCAKSRYKFIYLLFNQTDIQPVFQSFQCWAEK